MRVVTALLFSMALLTATSVVAKAPPPSKVQKTATSSAAEWLPRISLLARGGLSLVFEGEPQPTGFGDASEGGLVFQLVELEVTQPLGQYLSVGVDMLANETGFLLEDAWLQLADLSYGFGVRAGLYHTRLGFENERSRDQQLLTDQPLALGKMFGPLGHRVSGIEVSWTAPVAWLLRLHGSMMAANGPGSRSWYGDSGITLDSFFDLAWQLGLEGAWAPGATRIALDLSGSFGPLATGRKNRSDIWAFGLQVHYGHEDPDSIQMLFETEWLLRRRQIVGDLLQDIGGWAQIGVLFGRDYALAARYDLTQGVEGDFVDPTDDALRGRASLVAYWSPLRYLRVRFQGYADFGGPLEGEAFGLLLGFEGGYSTHGQGAEGIR